MVAFDPSVEDIIQHVRENSHVQDKLSIAQTYQSIGTAAKLPDTHVDHQAQTHSVKLGDDCAAIPDGNGGYTLFAAEGIISSFLENDPWFAGYSAVMVNISDVLSMGGLPTAVTDVLWGKDEEVLKEVWEGMKAASDAYDVPIVGGHTCYGTSYQSLGVSIIGTANRLLTSFDAKPGQRLLMAVDLNGAYFKHYPFWNASTNASMESLKRKKSLLKTIADTKLSGCAKDISMGGLLGSIAMLAHTSQVGFDIDFDQIIPPPVDDWVKWLTSFPSFGYILTCKEKDVEAIQTLFEKENVACSAIGVVTDQREINVVADNRISFCKI